MQFPVPEEGGGTVSFSAIFANATFGMEGKLVDLGRLGTREQVRSRRHHAEGGSKHQLVAVMYW